MKNLLLFFALLALSTAYHHRKKLRHHHRRDERVGTIFKIPEMFDELEKVLDQPM